MAKSIAWQRVEVEGFPVRERMVEVWSASGYADAYWTGKVWRTPNGELLDGIARWKYKELSQHEAG